MINDFSLLMPCNRLLACYTKSYILIFFVFSQNMLTDSSISCRLLVNVKHSSLDLILAKIIFTYLIFFQFDYIWRVFLSCFTDIYSLIHIGLYSQENLLSFMSYFVHLIYVHFFFLLMSLMASYYHICN